MAGYPYRVLFYNQRPRVNVFDNLPVTPLFYFINMVADIQNATIDWKLLKNPMELYDNWMLHRMDLTPNTGIKIYLKVPKLISYEESSYCALIPKPPPISIYQSIIVEPFDGLTWLFFVITIACSVAVWWMFQGFGAVESPLFLAYGMFVMFIGQGVDFSRRNRLVLTILLELIIIMIWILCNAYEGVITSFMIEPIRTSRLETFEDLVASNNSILTDDVFARAVIGSGIYESLEPRLNTSNKNVYLPDELKRKFHTIVISCDIAEVILNSKTGSWHERKIDKLYYMLPQKIFPILDQLEASFYNPYLERLQYFMDLSFQAGLMHIWIIYSREKTISYYDKSTSSDYDQPSYLKLDELFKVFEILMIGCSIALLLFFGEIFFHDTLKKIELDNQMRKIKNKIYGVAYKKRKSVNKGYRLKRIKRLRKLRVQKINVQPRFPMN